MRNAAQAELAKRNPNSLLDWSLAHRFLQGKPMRLIPALQELYRDAHPKVVVQKAAQIFVSEYLINTALWCADSGQGDRGNVLYVMPTQTQMDDFSQARFDKAIGESPYLQGRLFPPPPGRQGPARQRLKKVGQGYVYFRGADSRRQLTSVDADVVVLDEYDLMGEGVLELAQKRLASSRLGWLRVASTPRLPEAGINELFLHSDQRYYFLKCPGCGLDQRLEWEENVDRKRGQLVCRRRRCRRPMDLWAPGRWQPAAPGNNRIHGYHLNRLYSPLANIRQMIEDSEATTPSAMQDFQNSVLGETFVPPGGGASIDVLDRCREDYSLDEYAGQVCDMGVDVGTKLHVVVRESVNREDDGSTPRLWFTGELDSFDELGALLRRFNVRRCVIDSQPEAHLVRQFASGQGSKVWLARYDRHEPGHDREWAKGDDPNIYHVNRLEALDEMYQRFHEGRASLPAAARHLGGRVKDGLGEYYRELLAPKRTLEQDSQGNWIPRWVDNGKADHYAHAEVYCMLAEKCRSGAGMRWLVY